MILCGDDSTYSNTETAFYFDADISLFTIENNAFYGSDNINDFTSSNIKLTSFADTVIDLSNYNYYPKAGSAILTAGEYVLPQDIDCVDRGNPSSTIGAYEYQTGTSFIYVQ